MEKTKCPNCNVGNLSKLEVVSYFCSNCCSQFPTEGDLTQAKTRIVNQLVEINNKIDASNKIRKSAQEELAQIEEELKQIEQEMEK